MRWLFCFVTQMSPLRWWIMDLLAHASRPQLTFPCLSCWAQQREILISRERNRNLEAKWQCWGVPLIMGLPNIAQTFWEMPAEFCFLWRKEQDRIIRWSPILFSPNSREVSGAAITPPTLTAKTRFRVLNPHRCHRVAQARFHCSFTVACPPCPILSRRMEQGRQSTHD